MAGTIATTCPCCGDLTLTPAQVTLLPATPGQDTRYAFTCPLCRERYVRPLPQMFAARMRSIGVREERIPAEALEAHNGPPLTLDDLITLHYDLEMGLTA